MHFFLDLFLASLPMTATSPTNAGLSPDRDGEITRKCVVSSRPAELPAPPPDEPGEADIGRLTLGRSRPPRFARPLSAPSLRSALLASLCQYIAAIQYTYCD